MKKKFLAFLLSALMLVSLLPMTAFAKKEETNWAKLAKAMAGEVQESVQNVFTVEDNTPGSGVRTITLLTDITAEESDTCFNVPDSAKIVLDLNKHTLDRGLAEKQAAADGYIMYIGTGASLTVKNGKITGSNATGCAALYCNTTKSLDLIDVKLVNCKRGAVYLNNVDRTNVEGCTFSDNTSSSDGAAINASSTISKQKTITITDCLFKNNSITKGCGSVMRIYGQTGVDPESFTQYDVTIKDSTFTGNAVKSSTADDGGAICAYRVESLILDGCTITGNTALENNSCGGLAVGQYIKKFVIKGKTVIADNTCGGKPADLCSRSNLARVKLEGLKEGSRIGLGTTYSVAEVSPVTFVTNATADDLKYFFSDSTEYYVDFNTDHLELIAPAAGNHAINVLPSENGTVTTSAKEAAENAEITLTVTPNSGYRLKADSLTYKIGDDTTAYTINEDTDTYSFTMPAANVTVTAEFEEVPHSSGGGSVSRYPVSVESAKNGTFTMDKKSAAAGSTVTVTVSPDKGFTLETITVTDKNGKEIEVKSLGDDKYSFKMPSGKVTVEVTFMEDNTMLNFCVDVTASDYYYDAVLWAYENEICKGTDYVHFSPYAPVSRAQVVTFLWRAAGCPVVNYAMNMSDVKFGEYYNEAVRWALSEGITKGTSATAFSPNEVCTRGQIVTFLARFAGVADTDTASAFADIPADAFFAAAVKWAKDNGVTDGMTATTFEPYTDCNRAQVVTFLYRWMVK